MLQNSTALIFFKWLKFIHCHPKTNKSQICTWVIVWHFISKWGIHFVFSLFSPTEKLLNSSGRELRRALFSLKQIFQVDYFSILFLKCSSLFHQALRSIASLPPKLWAIYMYCRQAIHHWIVCFLSSLVWYQWQRKKFKMKQKPKNRL